MEDHSFLSRMYSADWLMNQQFPPTEYVVPGIVPEGLSLLVAAPKIGKSWMCLGLGLAAASGGYAFGHLPVQQRPVLYLALEDGAKRLQARLRSLDALQAPKNLYFLTDTKPGVVLSAIAEFVEQFAAQNPLVMLDTLGKVMPPAMPNETTYSRDYRVMGVLKGVVDDHPGSSLVCVHHTRKMDAADFLDAVSGTNGIAGAADTILVLRRDREEAAATLQVTSRDAREGSYGLTLSQTGVWSLSGTSLAEASAHARKAVLTSGVGDRMAQVVEYVHHAAKGVTPKEVAGALGMGTEMAGRYLRRAQDTQRIERSGRGLYTPVRSVRSVRNEVVELFPSTKTDTPDTTDTTSRVEED